VLAKLARTGQVQVIVRPVPQIRSRLYAARPSLIVNVTLDTVEKMEAHALSAELASIIIDRGQIFVQAVPQVQSLYLAVTQTLHVNVMLGTRGKMEARARSVL